MKIDCCMMVRDEAPRIAKAINSIKPWVDEVIVVDTGSVDGTQKICQDLGAKVYSHPWESSFSLHRNQAISYSLADWVITLDADEEFNQDTMPTLRPLLEKAPKNVGVYMINLVNILEGGKVSTNILHPRIFRNRSGFHYEGYVHNKPIVIGDQPTEIANIVLYHYGYDRKLNPEEAEKKHQRRLDMIGAWVACEPNNGQAYSYLAHIYAAKPETFEKAVETAQKGIELIRAQKANAQLPHAYHPMLVGLFGLGRDQECVNHALEIHKEFPWYADPLFYAACCYFRHEKWEMLEMTTRAWMDLQSRSRADNQMYQNVENMTKDAWPNVAFMRGAALIELEKAAGEKKNDAKQQ
jgi:tetratricopeptide (TPR) repeat protein